MIVKRWLLYLIILGITALSPIQRMDIAKLVPVEVVWMTEKAGQVYLHTDTGEQGWGQDVRSALGDLQASALGNIFLETADYVIVEQGSERLLEQCEELLRPSCKMCAARKMPDMELVVSFLSSHEPEITFRQWQVERPQLCALNEKEGRFAWDGK